MVQKQDPERTTVELRNFELRYAIITNPASGKMTVDQKRSVLAKAAEVLDAEIHGLDTIKASDLAKCAQHLAISCDVLVTAGGGRDPF